MNLFNLPLINEEAVAFLQEKGFQLVKNATESIKLI